MLIRNFFLENTETSSAGLAIFIIVTAPEGIILTQCAISPRPSRTLRGVSEECQGTELSHPKSE